LAYLSFPVYNSVPWTDLRHIIRLSLYQPFINFALPSPLPDEGRRPVVHSTVRSNVYGRTTRIVIL